MANRQLDAQVACYLGWEPLVVERSDGLGKGTREVEEYWFDPEGVVRFRDNPVTGIPCYSSDGNAMLALLDYILLHYSARQQDRFMTHLGARVIKDAHPWDGGNQPFLWDALHLLALSPRRVCEAVCSMMQERGGLDE